MSDLRFQKNERITHKGDIDALFDRSVKASRAGPLLLKTFIREKSSEKEASVKILVVVPKRNYKRAVDRNRVKRLLREAYRLNKGEYNLCPDEGNKTRLISVMYAGNALPSFKELEGKLIEALNRSGFQRLNKN